MRIVASTGYELEKEKSNSPEEFFNRSEVIYEQKGAKKVFQLLYLRYFEEQLPVHIAEPLKMAFGEDVAFRDVSALAALVNREAYQNRRKLYINNENEFHSLFADTDWANVQKLWGQRKG